MSHPVDDAFRAVDLWEGSDAVQVKEIQGEAPVLWRTEYLAFPAAEVGLGKTREQYYSNEYGKRGISQFFAKIREYGKVLGRNIKGYAFGIPRKKINFITGEPAPEIVEFFRKKLDDEAYEDLAAAEQ